MKKEKEYTLTAIRECLAKNMPPYGKAILLAHKLEAPLGMIATGTFLLS